MTIGPRSPPAGGCFWCLEAAFEQLGRTRGVGLFGSARTPTTGLERPPTRGERADHIRSRPALVPRPAAIFAASRSDDAEPPGADVGTQYRSASSGTTRSATAEEVIGSEEGVFGAAS
jgi:hypothetical protein